MNNKKQRNVENRATRRLTGFGIPEARKLNAALRHDAEADALELCIGFGARIVATREGLRCSLHPYDGGDDRLMSHGARRFVLHEGCCGYSLDEARDVADRPWIPKL